MPAPWQDPELVARGREPMHAVRREPGLLLDGTLGVFPRATWLALLADVGFEPHRVDGEQGLDVFIGVRRRR